MPVNSIEAAQSYADSALKKIRLTEAVLCSIEGESELLDPDHLWTLAQVLYDAGKDIRYTLDSLKKMGGEIILDG